MTNAWGESWGVDAVAPGGCVNGVCGTGQGTISPVPGDPNNAVNISAATVMGGIDVYWTYPTVNPHAVAYTKVFRSLNNNFDLAVQLLLASGSLYYDKLNPEVATDYYYWIQVVSINGTVGEPIGPASAKALPAAEQALLALTGKIDAGVLAMSLKEDIANIIIVGDRVIKEIQDRIDANVALGSALAAVQSDSESSMTFILNEISERKTANSATVNALNAMAVAVGENKAAIIEESTVRATKDEVLADQVTTLFGTVADNTAAIIQEAALRVSADDSIATVIDSILVTNGDLAAAIQNEFTARVNADEAISIATQTLMSRASADSAAAILAESQTRSAADSAAASALSTVQSNLNGSISSVQTSMTTSINNVAGKVNSIGALYTAKVSVNGLIGGFGVYNDGREVEAGFDVDTFWVGRTNADRVKPFIIKSSPFYVNGVLNPPGVYMSDTFITNGSIGTAKIGLAAIDTANIGNAKIKSLKIKGNAVTVPSFKQSAPGNFIAMTGTWQTILSTPVDFGDVNDPDDAAPSLVMVSGFASFYAQNNGDVSTSWLRILQDGVPGQMLVPANYSGGLTGLNLINDGFLCTKGVHIYELQAYCSGSTSYVVHDRSLTILGSKR